MLTGASVVFLDAISYRTPLNVAEMISPSNIVLLARVPHRERVRRKNLRVPDLALDNRRGGGDQDHSEHGEAKGEECFDRRDHLVEVGRQKRRDLAMTQRLELVVRNIHPGLVGITEPHDLGGGLVVRRDGRVVEARPPAGTDEGVPLPLRLLATSLR